MSLEVLIPDNRLFNYSQCKALYEKNRKFVNDNTSFDEVINNTFFYSFFKDQKHIGCIYYYILGDNRMYVNAFAVRKTHLINLECFKLSLSWFNCDIYAKTKSKTAIYCILKCGFKKVGKNLYKYER